MIPIESFEAHIKNNQMFKHIHDESLEATQWMAKEWGEPEWCKGHGVRNTHRCAIAPNMSSASMAGQVSQGIEPIIANVYTQATTAGEMQRINPEFLRIAKERKKFNKAMLTSVIDKQGSVQHLDWLDENEKAVFKTAFEIDQKVLLRLASTRQQWIDQGQSLNLFFDADEDEEYIADVHKMFFEDERLKGLYYLRTLSGVDASKDTCSSCEG
jgi:ribonucleoside-diphosphate reductase alpha chain